MPVARTLQLAFRHMAEGEVEVEIPIAPELTFRYDDRFDETAHIDALLHSPDVARDLDDKEE